MSETCRNGHVRTVINTYRHNGYRYCRECRTNNVRRHRAKIREIVLAATQGARG